MSKIQWVGLIAVAIIAIGGYFFPKVNASFGSVSTNCANSSTTCLTDLLLSDALQVTNGITVTATNAVNVLNGTTITNNLVQGSAGYSLTLSTAVNTSFTLTPAQFCSGTSVLLPPSNTTTITLTIPAASTTAITCGAAVGSWSQQIIENDSGFALTFATTTGQLQNTITGLQPSSFLYATGTPALSITYPPKIQATTTATMMGIFTSTSSIYFLIDQYSRAVGY